MSGLDAGVVGVLSPTEISVRATLPAPRPAPKPAEQPAPEPADDTRPLDELTADAAAAYARLESVREQSLNLAEKLESLDREIEAARAASLDPSATAALRADRVAILAELEELDELLRRAEAAHETTSRASSRARTRLEAGRVLAEIVALNATVEGSNARIVAAVTALLDAEDARAQLGADIDKLRADMAGIPADLRPGVPNSEAGLDVPTLLRFRQLNRRRRWFFQL
jgi:predicted  nucleic acid-binding Zn-ribbon protein